MVHTDLRQQLLGWQPRSEQEAGAGAEGGRKAPVSTKAGRELGGHLGGALRLVQL